MDLKPHIDIILKVVAFIIKHRKFLSLKNIDNALRQFDKKYPGFSRSINRIIPYASFLQRYIFIPFFVVLSYFSAAIVAILFFYKTDNIFSFALVFLVLITATDIAVYFFKRACPKAKLTITLVEEKKGL